MATIDLKKLKCIRTSDDEDGEGKKPPDNVYMKIFVDGRQVQRWPSKGHCDMRVGDEAYPMTQLSFQKDMKVELWEYDPTSSDDYMGCHVFDVSGSGAGQVTLRDPREGNIYQLDYQYQELM